MKYRPEIDGIRTLAILPVVLYHLKIPFAGDYLLPGGFLGVDVFFVISGFLITKIILDEFASTGRFSLKTFYLRRARRILPALILVILASMVAAFFLLSPTEMSRFGMSILAALGFFSNIYWFFTLGEYGAQSGLLQPLLHTWSLAIEEQFYLVFPLLLLLLKPMRRPGAALALISIMLVASLVLAEMTTLANKQMSFFSPVSRAWELLVGALMAIGLTHFPDRARPGPRLEWLLPKLGLVVLIGCMATIDLAVWNHPGVITLPVVLATAAIIWCARPGEAVTRLLSTSPFVFIGKLSYSIYLWHFPIFAFGRLSLIEQPGPVDMLLWVALTMACSIAGYYLIERRFRFAISTRAFMGTLGATCAVILGFVTLATTTNSLSTSRTGDLVTLYGGEFYDNEVLQKASWDVLNTLAGTGETIDPSNASRASENERNALWFTNDDALKILVIGNSHSKDLFNALHFATKNRTDVEIARFAMARVFPQKHRDLLFDAPNFKNADIVMIATRYRNLFEIPLPDLIAELKERGKTVVLVGTTPEFVSPGSLPIYDWYIRRNGSREGLENMNRIAYGSQLSTISQTNLDLQDIARTNDVIFLSRWDLVCSDVKKSCTLATPDGAKTMYDYGHWTLEGAQYFGEKIRDENWLDPVFNAPR